MYSTLCYSLQFESPQARKAASLYTCARKQAERGRLWAGLTGRSRTLLALAEVRRACSIDSQTYAGLRSVPINQIQGSENRSTEFDRDFLPLTDRNRARWLGIAEAREQGKALPPVSLTRVGDVYFVRDGHHRISVARALGQKAIEAKVIVWKVTRPLVWKTEVQMASTGFGRLLGAHQA